MIMPFRCLIPAFMKTRANNLEAILKKHPTADYAHYGLAM